MLFGNTEYINVMSVEVKIAKPLEFTRGIYLPCNKDNDLYFSYLILFFKPLAINKLVTTER